MFNGVPLVERIKRIVEKQVSILETWSEGEEGGLTESQLDQLRQISLIVRQMQLDTLEPTQAPGVVPPTGASEAELLAEVMGKK